MSMRELRKVLCAASMAAVFAAPAAANAGGEPGWYFNLEGFYSDIDDAEGDISVVAPEVSSGTPNECVLPIGLLGLQLELLGLCVLGNNSTLETVPGSSADGASTIFMDDGFGGGGGLGYRFQGGLRPELSFAYSENDIEAVVTSIGDASSVASGDGATLRAMRAMANVWFDIDLGAISPYLGGGIGLQNTELDGFGDSSDDDTTVFQAGGGIAFWFNPQVALSVDYRFVSAESPEFVSREANSGITTTRDGDFEGQTIGASLRYSFGAEGKDTDGDGVLDINDECPNTPAGVTVYANGCPQDLDQDGVPDYLDKCPNTPQGSPVNADGCPLDSDGDGVADHLDQCPGTPQGVKVDQRGCPLDADGDGVPDHLDQCPATKPGVAVDAQGCPLSDADGDGIPDHLDKCPNSPKGIAVGSDGCPLDTDGDGVPDHLDQCPNTPAGLKVLPDGCALEGDCRTPRPGEAVDDNGCALDKRFILKGVKFEFDSDRLTEPSKDILNDVADTLAFYPKISVEVAGHTDNVGTDAYNLGLSERRSNAVKRYLVGRGIQGERLRPLGYGETAPIETNDSEQGREENRRVEFKVIEKQ